MGKKRIATRFLKDVGAMVRLRAQDDPALDIFATALSDVQKGVLGRSPGTATTLPALNHLPTALDDIAVGDEPFRNMLRDTAAAMSWYSPYDQEEVGEGPSLGMAAGQLTGPQGLWRRNDLFTGFFLIQPGVHYPPHDHLADELYFLVSGSIDIQNGMNGAPRRIAPGQYSVTPSGVPHCLTTGETPALIVFIWTGQVACDVFWWEHLQGEMWRRFKPTLVRDRSA